ncbi:hypothetical protein MMC27_004632 [Xylographa pallens]|nr:hypothetical protein [Xylographa pallens]
MSAPAVTKLHHAFKEQHDERTPTGFSAERDPSDPDFDEKPTMAVCKGAEIVYEYRDGASLVLPALSLPGYTVDKMNQRYEITKKEWSEFNAAKLRKNVLNENSNVLNKVKIDQVICTGIGTLSAFHEQDADCNSYNQLAELEMFLEQLTPPSQGPTNKKMNIFMQDPSFNELDKAFLRGRGFHILEHPEAYNRMTATTFLYAAGNHDDVMYHAFRVVEPSLFVGNNLAEWGERNGLPNPDNKGQYYDASIRRDTSVIDGFVSRHRKFDLPVPEVSTATRSYWSLAGAVYY